MSMKEEDERISKAQTVGSSERSSSNEGIFSRPNFAQTVTSLIGNNVKVKTKTGSTYEGVFTSFSSNYEVTITQSHGEEPNDPFQNNESNETITFTADNIVSISCVNVNLEEALDLSQRLEFSEEEGDCESWKGNLNSDDVHPYVDKTWNVNQHLRPDGHLRDFNDDLEDYPFYSRPTDFIKESKISQNADDYQSSTHDSAVTRGDYPKPQRKQTFAECGSIVHDEYSVQENRHTEKSSSLNPYAKPFMPKEPASTDKEPLVNSSIPSLAAVVLPTYCVSGNNPQVDTTRYGKSEGLVGAPSLLGSGSFPNHYMHGYSPYGDGYDEKLYSTYDSIPLSAHDYQQYYPHLQYIQYFRRFY